MANDFEDILVNGISFSRGGTKPKQDDGKVKTKAKKKKYITGAHGSGSAKQKAEMLDAARMLVEHGYELYATGGTSKYLADNGIDNTLVHWPSDSGQPQALDLLHQHKIDMVVNIPKNLTSHELTNGYKIRRAAIDLNVPLITNSRLASAFIQAFCTIKIEDIGIKSWAEYR